MTEIAALLAAFNDADLVLPVYDGDPPTEETAEAFVKALAEQGYRIVPNGEPVWDVGP